MSRFAPSVLFVVGILLAAGAALTAPASGEHLKGEGTVVESELPGEGTPVRYANLSEANQRLFDRVLTGERVAAPDDFLDGYRDRFADGRLYIDKQDSYHVVRLVVVEADYTLTILVAALGVLGAITGGGWLTYRVGQDVADYVR
jgi:hypothetical protein